MSSRKENRLSWEWTADTIRKTAKNLMSQSKLVYDSVGALSADTISYDNVVKALANNDCEYNRVRRNLDFIQHVSPDSVLRDASVEVDKELSEFDVEMSMRQDVFDVIVAYEKRMSKDNVTPECKRFIERLIKLGKRNGLHLSSDIQLKIKRIEKELRNLTIDYMANLSKENTVLLFTQDELVGVPEDLVSTFDKDDDGKLKVTLKYPHYFPCIKKACNPQTRRKLETAFTSRCLKSNTAILEELIKLRNEKADLLGFPTHAAFVLDILMAKNPETVQKFLSDLASKLRYLQKEEIKLYLQYKREECQKYNYEDDGEIHFWDIPYYMTMLLERKYGVDLNVLKEYFPMEVVTRGLLEIYQELLNLTFTAIHDADVWHPDVTMYSVQDKSTSELLGYFYLDLYPREGKYGHAACFCLQPGCLGPDGKRQVAITAMVTNFTKPTKEKPALLTHSEVNTYFHEFGHLMHDICAQAEFALFSGLRVERDFLEAPSQMLQNWCWEKEPLLRMSKHYKTGELIPDDLLDKLIKSRTANDGIFNLRRILLGTFDQTIHRKAEADTAAVFSNLSKEFLGILPTEGTNMAASFEHLADEYDAQFYGYLWSEVFCMDMFYSRFKKEGMMNPKVGADYRKYILQPGGSQDASEMLRNFLGRDPTPDAFLISKGLKSE